MTQKNIKDSSSPKLVKECQGLSLGSKAPSFIGIDQHGNKISLREQLKKGPVILFFYRGQWCPLCNKHLQKIQRNIEHIQAKGAVVIAVTPEKQELIHKTIVKNNISFLIITDENKKIMQEYDVAFLPTKRQKLMYNLLLRANLSEAHLTNDETLPIPATYIINQKGVIVSRHFDQDYKQRFGVEQILEELSKMGL